LNLPHSSEFQIFLFLNLVENSDFSCHEISIFKPKCITDKDFSINLLSY
jgi:hypothetical protein